jgi:hypothetical protein
VDNRRALLTITTKESRWAKNLRDRRGFTQRGDCESGRAVDSASHPRAQFRRGERQLGRDGTGVSAVEPGQTP